MALPAAVRRLRRHAGVSVLAVVVTVSSTGCFTGDRPTLAEGPVETGDPSVDAVLTRLESGRTETYTADYEVLTRFGGLTSSATVVQAAPDRRSITIGSVRFLYDGPDVGTCALETGACSDTIDAARVSDTMLGPDFYGSSAATRLRRDAGLRVGPTVPSRVSIAGEAATCVAIPVTGATSTFCALDSGVLARLDAADVSIDLTGYRPEPDESLFSPTR